MTEKIKPNYRRPDGCHNCACVYEQRSQDGMRPGVLFCTCYLFSHILTLQGKYRAQRQVEANRICDNWED